MEGKWWWGVLRAHSQQLFYACIRSALSLRKQGERAECLMRGVCKTVMCNGHITSSTHPQRILQPIECPAAQNTHPGAQQAHLVKLNLHAGEHLRQGLDVLVRGCLPKADVIILRVGPWHTVQPVAQRKTLHSCCRGQLRGAKGGQQWARQERCQCARITNQPAPKCCIPCTCCIPFLPRQPSGQTTRYAPCLKSLSTHLLQTPGTLELACT